MLHFRMDMPLHLMALYGSMMILAVCLFRRLLKNRFPKFVFPMLWGLVMIRLLIPFSISSPISAPVPKLQLPPAEAALAYIVQDTSEEMTTGPAAITYGSTMATGPEAISYGFSEATDFAAMDWSLVLWLVFGLGAVTTASILLFQKQHYSRKLRSSLLIEHNETINTILREMGMGHILVFSSDEITSPLVCSVLRPRIYLPTCMDFQNTELLRHILVHETMHIKRGDNWIKTTMLVILCVHWYNPLVWLMSNYLASDLETACDAAVLSQFDTDTRQNYACSLLAMAITGNRSTLLYSAFSKTEVEKRIKSVLQYKKATTLVLALSIIFLLSGTVVFATGGQAPFSSYLSSYCKSADCRWGVKASLSRDVFLGKNPQKRADNVILDVLDTDNTNDPAIITDAVRTALSKEFGLEKGAFRLVVSLCLNEEEVAQEYAQQGITKGKDGLYLYKGEPVRDYTDEMLSSVQTREDGTVDITVVRDQLGNITSVTALHKGDDAFDAHTKEMKRNHRYDISAEPGTSEETIVVEEKP